MSKIRTGDIVYVRPGVTGYTYTKPGSWGRVQIVYPSSALVRFAYMGRHYQSNVFVIHSDELSVLPPAMHLWADLDIADAVRARFALNGVDIQLYPAVVE